MTRHFTWGWMLRHAVAVLLFGAALAVVGCSKSPTAPSSVGSGSVAAIGSPVGSAPATASWTQYSDSSMRPSEAGRKPGNGNGNGNGNDDDDDSNGNGNGNDDDDDDDSNGNGNGNGNGGDDDDDDDSNDDDVDGGLGQGPLKVDVCHRRGSGTFLQITVAAPALAAHLNHGDAEPGGTTSDGIPVGLDCEGTVLPACPTPATFFQDADGDGYGDSAVAVSACAAPIGFVLDASDCNDADPGVNPGAAEACDAVDNNCNLQVDEGNVCGLCSNPATVFQDADGDGFGDPAVSVLACTAPFGFVLDATDCNDANRAVNPTALEVCDAVDNNCNLQVDEGNVCGLCPAPTKYYRDADGDRFGDPTVSVLACTRPTGFVLNGTDCADTNPAVNPGVPRTCARVR